MAVIPERQKLNKLSCVIAQAYCLESINSGRGTQEETKVARVSRMEDQEKESCTEKRAPEICKGSLFCLQPSTD